MIIKTNLENLKNILFFYFSSNKIQQKGGFSYNYNRNLKSHNQINYKCNNDNINNPIPVFLFQVDSLIVLIHLK